MNLFETYLTDLEAIYRTGANTKETSFYPAINTLFDGLGKTLKPRVRCVLTLKNQGAGMPDGGFFTASQLQRGDNQPQSGQPPERGAIEIKGLSDDVQKIADSAQVRKYLAKYGLVLVTNYRDFLLVAQENGETKELERYTLAESAAEFWRKVTDKRAFAAEHEARFLEYLKRVMQHNAPLSNPQEVAWFLASYARDAKARIETVDFPALKKLREALEEALGIRFEGERGENFFHSTLIQTLFYGVFSAWVLWHKENPQRRDDFRWREAGFYLGVPVIQVLFDEIAKPSNLRNLDLVEVLDWTGNVLNRIVRQEFFARFDEGQAVQYFYEPFLQQFDPELRKQLGVWYTPQEIVKYMVARVDTVLREELNLADGLADPNVYVLDPCCGTGAYLVEVLNHIHRTLEQRGEGALAAEDLKRAATRRVFGFEILPAPFVVAHLQLGLLLNNLGANIGEGERVGVYLTNALTGWEPAKEPKTHFLYPEMEAERDQAEAIKRDTPILVIIGNPPYNGYAGVAIGEERELSNAYRTTVNAPAPQGQGLNELYVRFFRMAERRIAEMTHQGVVSFISSYSWLEGLSHPGMRERFIEAFDKIWIDNLNGDKYKTGKLTPEGKPDPSVFSTEFNREGIQVGTAIATLVRKGDHEPIETIHFRDLWGKEKLAQLSSEAEQKNEALYQTVKPTLELGLIFTPAQTNEDYHKWALLPELFPISFPGVQSGRDDVVVDIDREKLVKRMEKYFDANINNDELKRIAPGSMADSARFDAQTTRAYLLKRGLLPTNFFKFSYRPFDLRWLYWEPETKLLDEKRAEYFPHVFEDNIWLVGVQQNRKVFDPPFVTSHISSRHLIERGANMFPLYLRPKVKKDLFSLQENSNGEPQIEPNLSEKAKGYLQNIEFPNGEETLFHHVIAILHAPHYRIENASSLKQNFPRVPLPSKREVLQTSASLGKEVAALLDTETAVVGVTSGNLLAPFSRIGVPAKTGGTNLQAADYEVRANWGYGGRDGAVTMPGKGKIVVRDYSRQETEAIEQAAARLSYTPEQILFCLGAQTVDVYLNNAAYWCSVPQRVWEYTIGGYQVMKKWLSYREFAVLGRALTADEVREVMNMARRLTALVLLEPKLNENYAACKNNSYDWNKV